MLPANIRLRAISILFRQRRSAAMLPSPYPVRPSRFGFADAPPFPVPRGRGGARADPRPARLHPPTQPCDVLPVVACLESAPARSLSAKAVPHHPRVPDPVCLLSLSSFDAVSRAWRRRLARDGARRHAPTAWKAYDVRGRAHATHVWRARAGSFCHTATCP